MSSSTLPALRFAPTAAFLEEAIGVLERLGDASGSAVDAEQRRLAFQRYLTLPIPGGRPGPAWKHDYAKLRFDDLRWTSDRRSVPTLPFVNAAEADADRPALALESAGGLVHAGATLLEPPASAPGARGVVVRSLADARRAAGGELLASARLDAAIADDRFAALATAFQNCGAYVYVPDGVVLDAPIQLVFANPEPGTDAVFPRILVVLGAGARATVIERQVGDGRPFVCGVVAAQLGDRAELDYVALQNAGDEARLFMTRTGDCGRHAHLRWHLADLGGTLTRTVLDAKLDHPGAQAHTSALFFNTGMQHADLTTAVDHTVGDTISTTVTRSAASDAGQGRYVGNIVIRKGAHGSDASLRDDALLLSRKARIDSVPALEISANGVKAFHGATVGSLDRDELFYVSSRGIAKADAVRMIALAFFEPAIARFPGESVRDEVRTALDAKIDDATEIDA